jgi:DNA invertase Pin-like site-specific DNA recombinase
VSLVGYARVSTTEQHPELQHQTLTGAGCERIWVDTASGARADRPQLRAALDYLRGGDTLVVWRLDRLGRSLSHLVATLDDLHERGVGFRSLTEGMDTDTPQGKLLFHLLAAFAEFERCLIAERVRAGLAAARANGRRGGRPAVLTPTQVRYVRRMHAEHVPVTEIARACHCSRATVYRALELAPAGHGQQPGVRA